MTWTTFNKMQSRRGRRRFEAIEPGVCSISTCGTMLLHTDDLNRIGIAADDRFIAVCVNRPHCCIGLRRPAAKEAAHKLIEIRNVERRHLTISAAIAFLDVPPSVFSGRHTLFTSDDGGMLFVDFAAARPSVPAHHQVTEDRQ